MKDRSRLVTFAALVALVVAVTSFKSGLPSLEAIGDSLFWVLGAFFVFYLIRGGGCCGKGACKTAAPTEDDAE
ncbi:MAG: hypothetical protein ACC655_01755 [Rhodothermia bacterium]